MPLRLRISARAASQIRQAARWWTDNRPLAPDAFRQDLSEAFALLANHPGIGSPCESLRVASVRRLLIGRIRYFIYYRLTDDALDVLALWHTSRGEQPPV